MSGETVYILMSEHHGTMGVFYSEEKALKFVDKHRELLKITAPVEEIKSMLDDGETLISLNNFIGNKDFWFADWCIDNDYGYMDEIDVREAI